jgi:nitrite reductase (NO-forming)/hydroxylamine reductase
MKHVPGNLFVKTHPKSKHFWADAAQNPDKDLAESVAVWDMADLSKPKAVLNVAKDSGLPETKAVKRAVHPEYSADGKEVWISLWGGKTDQSAIVVYDDNPEGEEGDHRSEDDHPDRQVQRVQHAARHLLITSLI